MFASRLNNGLRGSFWLLACCFFVTACVIFFTEGLNDNYYYPNIFYNFLTSKLTPSFFIFLINQFFLLVAMALVSYIISNEEITEKLNYFPVFIFFVINAAVCGKEEPSVFLLSNIILLFVLHQIISTYRKEHALSNLFTACFWASIAVYLNITNVFILPVILVSLLVLRPFYWREQAVCLFGFIAPAFIYECLAYLFSFNQWYVLENLNVLFSQFRVPSVNTHYLPLLAVLLLLLLFSLIYYLVYGFGNTVKKQKSKSIFLWYTIFATPLIFTTGVNYANIALLYAIPLCFLLGDFFFLLKNKKLVNLFSLMAFLCLLYFLITKTGWLAFYTGSTST